jgi:putative addiction module antidote
MSGKKYSGLGEDKGATYGAGPAKTGVVPLKITQIGNSLGVILPKELLAKLNVDKGDVIMATDSDGGVRLTVFSPTFEAQIEAATRIMKRRRAVLRELAK